MSRKNENKKGANGAGSIRKITTTRNGKEYTYWQGRYTEGYDACTGKQIQRSITGKTQKEVAQKLRQITAEIDAKTYVAPCKLSISEWMSIWAQDYLVGATTSPHLPPPAFSPARSRARPRWIVRMQAGRTA